jgi:hypothetical protein
MNEGHRTQRAAQFAVADERQARFKPSAGYRSSTFCAGACAIMRLCYARSI